MGQRTYLTYSSASNSVELFEANNVLPFFWVALIRDHDLQVKIPEMKKACQLLNSDEPNEKDQHDNHNSANITILKADALTNARSVFPFITTHFPETSALYNDFIAYLDLKLNEKDVIKIDLLSLTAFLDIDSLIENILRELRAIKENNPESVNGYFYGDINYSLVGSDEFCGNEFKNHSPAYSSASHIINRSDNISVHENISLDSGQLKKRRAKASFLMICGLVFLYITAVGFQKEGVSLATVGCFIIGIALAWIAIGKFKNGKTLQK
ncbi:hypothetical protein ACVWYN_002230 [Pedobacter sp. UYP24]